MRSIKYRLSRHDRAGRPDLRSRAKPSTGSLRRIPAQLECHWKPTVVAGTERKWQPISSEAKVPPPAGTASIPINGRCINLGVPSVVDGPSNGIALVQLQLLAWGQRAGDYTSSSRCWEQRLERTARKHFLSWIRSAKRRDLLLFQKAGRMIGERLDDNVGHRTHPLTSNSEKEMNSKPMYGIQACRKYRHHETIRMALFFLGRCILAPRH